MKLQRLDFLSIFLILIISFLFVVELFLFPGRPASFDTNFHITNIAQFSKILSSGEFPVVWMNNFANYGLPMGIFAHQITNYLGGFINILINNPTATYNILVFLGIFLSGSFFYLFLRNYFSVLASFLGTFVFTFAPYKIFNIYIRGAMPEVFSAIFLPLILISLYFLIVKRKSFAFFLLAISTAGLALCHPMMLVVYSAVYLPYLIYLISDVALEKKQKIKLLFISFTAMLLGFLICSYYVLPLNLEIKYVYYGFIKNHVDNNSFLTLQNFFNPSWHFFTKSEIFTRGHMVLSGLIETLLFIAGLIYYVFLKFIKKTKEHLGILLFALVSGGIAIFFTTGISSIFYQKLFFLNDIQFPWRFLSSFIFIPPIIIAFFYDKYPKKIIFFLIVFAVSFLSFQGIYGKNYNIYPRSLYYFTVENVHSILMNTIWTGKSEDYPNKNPQGKIIEGQGKIESENLKNSSRNYVVDAASSVKMVDHTFYFPGWYVYVDNVKTNIEFQNPDYRGVITYNVPQGLHTVRVIFEDTKVRLLGKIITMVALIVFMIIFIIRKKLSKFII